MDKTLAVILLIGAATLGQAQSPAQSPAQNATPQAARIQSPTASAAASAVEGSASAPKAVRRPLTPEELRDTAQFPDGALPDQPVLPQVVVPLGKKPVALPPTAAGPKIDDQVARCKALTDPRHKAACVHAAPASS